MDPELQRMWEKIHPKVANPRAFTAEEVREKLLSAIRTIAQYWAEVKLDPARGTIRDRCDGVAFSILAMLHTRDAPWREYGHPSV